MRQHNTSWRDLVAESLAEDLIATEALATAFAGDAAAYRDLVLLTLERVHELTIKLRRQSTALRVLHEELTREQIAHRRLRAQILRDAA
jgi:hypothetical protein